MKVTRTHVIALLIMILIITSFVVPAYFAARADNTALRLECRNAEANVVQLRALASLEEELGIPVRFEIPTIPEVCDEVLAS